MEVNEKKHEKANTIAIADVNSSIILIAILLLICKEVMTKRQKPSRLADVLKMC